MPLTPLAARTTLQFSNIQCSWCSGDTVSENVPDKSKESYIAIQKETRDLARCRTTGERS